MYLKALSFFILVFILACGPSGKIRESRAHDQVLQHHIDAVGNAYAPDKRTTWYRIDALHAILKGETNSAAAKAALLSRLNELRLDYVDSISVLPASSVGEKTKGVIALSVANIRTQPSHKAELATQSTMGTSVRIWNKERGWYLVQTPDDYLGWIDGEGVYPMDSVQYQQWSRRPKIIFSSPFGFAYDLGDSAATISDLVYGDVLAYIDSAMLHYTVQLPGGRMAKLLKSQSMPFHLWRGNLDPRPDKIISAAKTMLGIPYLWGGTSFKGVDCSGFTKTVFFMNGIILPRDASQQAMLGIPVNTTGGWQHLLPGDLLFFGRPARDGSPEQVVHVGIWIGDGTFIHASGKVQVASLVPGAPNYDAGEHKRFLRASRILPNHGLFDLRIADLF